MKAVTKTQACWNSTKGKEYFECTLECGHMVNRPKAVVRAYCKPCEDPVEMEDEGCILHFGKRLPDGKIEANAHVWATVTVDGKKMVFSDHVSVTLEPNS